MNLAPLLNISPTEVEHHPSDIVPRATFAYISHEIQPYIDTLNNVTTVNGVIEWIKQVFGGDYADYKIDLIRNRLDRMGYGHLSDVDKAKHIASLSLINILMEGFFRRDISDVYLEPYGLFFSEPMITPWDLANNRIEEAIQLFGQPTDVLSMTVTVNGNNFTHELTRELAIGILAGAQEEDDIIISFNGIPLERDRFLESLYTNNVSPDVLDYEYSVKVYDLSYGFNTPDFMQGVLTAANWLDVDINDIIIDFINNKTGDPLRLVL